MTKTKGNLFFFNYLKAEKIYLDNEEFKSVPLCTDLGISRSQLFRKIKDFLAIYVNKHAIFIEILHVYTELLIFCDINL